MPLSIRSSVDSLSSRLSGEKPLPRPTYYCRMNPEEQSLWSIIVSNSSTLSFPEQVVLTIPRAKKNTNTPATTRAGYISTTSATLNAPSDNVSFMTLVSVTLSSAMSGCAWCFRLVGASKQPCTVELSIYNQRISSTMRWTILNTYVSMISRWHPDHDFLCLGFGVASDLRASVHEGGSREGRWVTVSLVGVLVWCWIYGLFA